MNLRSIKNSLQGKDFGRSFYSNSCYMCYKNAVRRAWWLKLFFCLTKKVCGAIYIVKKNYGFFWGACDDGEGIRPMVHRCGPRISLAQCVSHSMTSSIFIWKIDFYWLFENDLESPLIFVLFLKGKQNKKEKP